MELNYRLAEIKPIHFIFNSVVANQTKEESNMNTSYKHTVNLISRDTTNLFYEVKIDLVMSFFMDKESKFLLGSLAFEANFLVTNLQIIAKDIDRLNNFFFVLADITFNTMRGYWAAKIEGQLPINNFLLPFFEKEMMANSNYTILTIPQFLREFDNFMALESYDFAENLIQKALQKFPKNRDLQIALTRVYFNTNQATKSLDILDTILKDNPEDVLAYLGYLPYYNQTNQYAEIIKFSSLALDNLAKKPDNIFNIHTILRNRANAYVALKDYENAKKDVLEILALEPNNEETRTFLAHINGKLGKKD